MVGGAVVTAIGFVFLVKALSVPLMMTFPANRREIKTKYVIASTIANGHQMAARCKALLLMRLRWRSVNTPEPERGCFAIVSESLVISRLKHVAAFECRPLRNADRARQ
jgi:hypothetical protein